MSDYSPESYSDEEEYQDNVLDEQREAWDESYGPYPAAKKPESLYGLFNKVWRTHDSSKVANLKKNEIGDLGISVRDCQNIAMFARYLGHKGVASHFNKMAQVTLATSMSRDGWFVELFVTSKKFAQKGVKGDLPQTAGNEKWKIFGRKKPQPPVQGV